MTPTLEPLDDRILPAPLTPGQVRHAYGLDLLPQYQGQGYTVAVTGAGDAPLVRHDLGVFSAAFGLPLADLEVLSSDSFSDRIPGPQPWSDWQSALEMTMDLQWAHAVAPYARLKLVEAASPWTGDMLAAVNVARNEPGVSVVSMSWGNTDQSVAAGNDVIFTTPIGHPAVSFVAAAGDWGPQNTLYPATSPNVLSVGWPDPASGNALALGLSDIWVYYTPTGWISNGASSGAAPQWAGLVAVADSIRGAPIGGWELRDTVFRLMPGQLAAPTTVRVLAAGDILPDPSIVWACRVLLGRDPGPWELNALENLELLHGFGAVAAGLGA